MVVINGDMLPDPVAVHEAQKEQHSENKQDNTTSLCNGCRFAFRRSYIGEWDGDPELSILCCGPWLKTETRHTHAVSACNGFVEGTLLDSYNLTKALETENNGGAGGDGEGNNTPALPPVNPPAQSGEGGTKPTDPPATEDGEPPASGEGEE